MAWVTAALHSQNGFDELKNQWRLSGFTTQDSNRCQLTARAVALLSSWYCSAAHPGACLEAITNRPLLPIVVGKVTSHACQTQLYWTPMHARSDTINTLSAHIRTVLQHVRVAAEQSMTVSRYATPWRYICLP